ncbi:MAG: glutamate formimidoyltransferase [Firmicutes bacterium]|nr:glutamate formimidoyltransferase [Bacillota bacterium]
MRVVECVPNFSEGRRPEVIEAIVNAAKEVPGITVLDVNPDHDHNRVVVTFIGEPEAVSEAAFRSCKKASELIDLNQHHGEHPRMGATDVIPFVPLAGVTMEDCVQLAEALGERIARELDIPVYLYEQAARVPERRNLADVRRGEFEGLRTAIKEEGKQPDFGRPELHPTAGITAVGARPPLIAFNVNLDTDDLKLARRIARRIRESGGGFKAVKALGVMLGERNLAQVSMNMVDYRVTGLLPVYEAIKEQAAAAGVGIVGSEIVGLLPLQALLDVALQAIKVESFDTSQIIETHLRSE